MTMRRDRNEATVAAAPTPSSEVAESLARAANESRNSLIALTWRR
jgi:hypothetical protein